MEVKEKLKTKEPTGQNPHQSKTRKTFADIYGKLKRGLDSLEYQNEARHG
jgi:hypothetical protein